MKFHAFAARAADSISASVARSLPYVMFSRMDMANRLGSWLTRPMLCRSDFNCRQEDSVRWERCLESPFGDLLVNNGIRDK